MLWDVSGAFWTHLGLGDHLGLHLGCILVFLDGFLEVLFVGALRLDFGMFFERMLLVFSCSVKRRIAAFFGT